jgi:hypothetical protein
VKQGLNVEVPAKGVYSRRTAKHVIVEGVVTAGPKGSIDRDVYVFIPHHVIERMATPSPVSAVIDVEEES